MYMKPVRKPSGAKYRSKGREWGWGVQRDLDLAWLERIKREDAKEDRRDQPTLFD